MIDHLVVAVCSCEQNAHKQEACAAAWLNDAQELPGMDAFFFTGAGPCRRQGIHLHLDCRDDYHGLPSKVSRMLAYVKVQYPDSWLFKCDDDTFVAVDRLCKYAQAASEYSGHTLDAGDIKFASGGAGYLLSPRAVEIASNDLRQTETGPEDVLVAMSLAQHGIFPSSSDRFGPFFGRPARPNNDVITEHWVPTELMSARRHFLHCTHSLYPTYDTTDLASHLADYKDIVDWLGPSLSVVFGLAKATNATSILEVGSAASDSTETLQLVSELTSGHLTSIHSHATTDQAHDGERNRPHAAVDTSDSLRLLRRENSSFDFVLFNRLTGFREMLLDLAIVDEMVAAEGAVLIVGCSPQYQPLLDAFTAFRSRRNIAKTLVPHRLDGTWHADENAFGLIRYV